MFSIKNPCENLIYYIVLQQIIMEIAYILLTCRQGKFKIVSNALKKYEEIEELHEVYGRFDIIAKVTCHNQEELQSFIQNKLQITEGVRTTETLLANDVSNGS